MAPAAIRSDAAKTASMSGRAARRCSIAAAPPSWVKSAVASSVGSGARLASVDGVAVAREPVGRGDHVARARDDRDDPPAARDEVVDGAPRAAAIVDVDVARRAGPEWPSDDDGRDAGGGDPGREGVVAVKAHQQGAVDVAGGEVVGCALGIGEGGGHQQDQLDVAGRQRRADAAQQAREERVAEQPAGRFGDDDADRSAPPGDQAARGAVGDVGQLDDGGFDLAPDVGGHPRRAVDHARDGRAGDAGERGDLLERRTVAAVAGWGICHRTVSLL